MALPVDVPDFVPAAFVPTGHLQTLAAIWPRTIALASEPVRIPVEDGVLFAQWTPPASAAQGAALILHGIGGDGDETFVRGTAAALVRRGLGALRIDLRGAGRSRELSGIPLFHAGRTDDVRAALGWLSERVARTHLVGFSLGGQLVLRTAGELGTSAPASLRSITAISPPLDLAASARFTESALGTPYRKFIVAGLIARTRPVASRLPPGVTLEPRKIKTIRDYDDRIVARCYGFRDADDYYARCASMHVVKDIASPTLVLHADDDPVVPVGPVERLTGLSNIRVLRTRRGGHCGYVGRARAGETRFWADERAAEWARAHDD